MLSLDKGRKLKVHKTFQRHLGRLIKVLSILSTFNLCLASGGLGKNCKTWPQYFYENFSNQISATILSSIPKHENYKQDLLTYCMELQYQQEQHVRKLFYKSLLNFAYLWGRAGLTKNKKQNYFSLPGHQLAEYLILRLCFKHLTETKTTCRTSSTNIRQPYTH